MAYAMEHHSHDPVPSRWPIITAIGAGLIPIGIVASTHGAKEGIILVPVPSSAATSWTPTPACETR